MKNNAILFLIIMVVFTITAGCAEVDETTYIKTYDNPEYTILACIGEKFIISLDSGRSTSYFYWQTEYDDKMLSLVDGEYKELYYVENDPSVGGVMLFTFQALATGDTYIYMTYEESLPGETPRVLDKKAFVIHISDIYSTEVS